MIKVPDRITTIANNTPLLLCRFSNDFDVLIERMNDDHKKIFDYINTIHSRIKEKTDNKSLLPIFKELAEFTRGHFAREEAAMAQADYIDLGLQQKAHEKLLKSISDMINDLEKENAVDLLEVMTFLRDWLMTHIMVMDRKYGPVLKERGIS
jgi:hemerythrin-like metal-binding protein